MWYSEFTTGEENALAPHKVVPKTLQIAFRNSDTCSVNNFNNGNKQFALHVKEIICCKPFPVAN